MVAAVPAEKFLPTKPQLDLTQCPLGRITGVNHIPLAEKDKIMSFNHLTTGDLGFLNSSQLAAVQILNKTLKDRSYFSACVQNVNISCILDEQIW